MTSAIGLGAGGGKTVASMSADEFRSRSFVLPVETGFNAVTGAFLRHSVPAGDRSRSRWLEFLAAGAAMMGTTPSRVSDRLLQIQMTDDLWYGALPDGSMVILAQAHAYHRLPESEIVEQVHANEVRAAHRRGEEVPQDIWLYYRDKPRAPLAHPAGES